MKSEIKELGQVAFPEFTGERAYMVPIINKIIPSEFKRWEQVIGIMLNDVELKDVVYMTIDQKAVKKGDFHRRSGAHIDGNYTSLGWGSPPGWITDNLQGGGIMLASDNVGCIAYEGTFNGFAGDGGDCSHIDLSASKASVLSPNKAYLGNVTMVHETIPAIEDQNRSFIRLTLPESYRFYD